uniref:Uncharacterized protein n=1 Tax=viral metagenome TaxID=1070528 RepID=A0A6M3IPC5_9ZZZZ
MVAKQTTKAVEPKVQLSYQAFAENAIRKMRNIEKSKGIHTVYTKLGGYNITQYMSAYYGDSLASKKETVHIQASPARQATEKRPYREAKPERDIELIGANAVIHQLVKAKAIEARPVLGGQLIFIKGEMPKITEYKPATPEALSNALGI